MLHWVTSVYSPTHPIERNYSHTSKRYEYLNLYSEDAAAADDDDDE